MATFRGERDDNFALVDDLKEVASDVAGLRDTIGAKKANVYFLVKEEGQDDIWSQVLPTPDIQFFDLQQSLDSGGVVSEGDILLKQIPIQKYEEEGLQTFEESGKRKFWVVSGPGLETKAFVTSRIEKDLLFFNVYLRRYKSLNSSDLTVPAPQ